MSGVERMAIAERAALMRKLRRVGGFFLLFVVLMLAAVHWISQDAVMGLAAGIPARVRDGTIRDAVFRLNVVLVVSGIVILPVFFMAGVLVTRFVRHHFSEMEAASRRKSRFVSMVSHELKTPLNSIQGFANLLGMGVQGKLSRKQKEYAEEILGGVTHLKTVVGDLLDLGRIEAGYISIRKEEVTLSLLLGAVTASMGPIASCRGVRIEVAGDEGMTVQGDPGRLKQIFINLISNAIRFSPREGVVRVSWTDDGDRVLFVVADSGCGMDGGDIRRLFRDYFQAKSSQDISEEGTGLGLAISRELIELHGGRVWVESMVGAGSRFCFILPAGGGVTGETGRARGAAGRGPAIAKLLGPEGASTGEVS